MAVVFGSLTYFGIFEPSMMVPERCNFGNDIICDDFQVVSLNEGLGGEQGILMVDLRHTFGKTVYLQDFSCQDLETGAATIGLYHEAGDSIAAGGGTPSYEFGSGPMDPDMQQWRASESITLKCSITPNPYTQREREKILIPGMITLQVRQNGFNHEYEGEVVGAVRTLVE